MDTFERDYETLERLCAKARPGTAAWREMSTMDDDLLAWDHEYLRECIDAMRRTL